MSSRIIYLDNAASTPVSGEVKKEMDRGLALEGNPSSYNDEGRKARKALEEARLKISRFLGARTQEVIFTSSGTEANNLAIKGAAGTSGKGEIITTPIEHPSVIGPVKYLARRGYKAIYLSVDRYGLIDPEELKKKITSRTLLISVMYANNEIGTIEPVLKISKIVKEFRGRSSRNYPLFHIDACQAAGYLDMNVNRLKADLLSFNGAKLYGPKGIGVLYVRRGVRLHPEMLGGNQESGLRAGTENLPAILGLAQAVSMIKREEGKKTAELRDYFIRQIKRKLPEAVLNGPEGDQRLPNNISISISGLSSENILLELDKHKIYAGNGSACTARSVEPSHVLKAIGREAKYMNGTIRFSLGRQTTKKDIDYVLKVLPRVIDNLRKRYNKTGV